MSEKTPAPATPEESPARAVARFLRRRDEQRRVTRRFYATTLVLGGLIGVLQLLASKGLVPELDKDAALSTAVVLFGLANSSKR